MVMSSTAAWCGSGDLRDGDAGDEAGDLGLHVGVLQGAGDDRAVLLLNPQGAFRHVLVEGRERVNGLGLDRVSRSGKDGEGGDEAVEGRSDTGVHGSDPPLQGPGIRPVGVP